MGEAERPARREKRLVHYNGYAKLRATSVRDTLEQAGAAAKTAGGYVEKLAGSSITLRVPVDRFRAVFAALLKLGDVLSRSVTAEDVTDSFRAVDLRLHTAIATRERLQALLALARTEQEKLELLRQIQRVTSEIDELTAMFETLKSLASYSRISLEVVPRQALTTQPSRAEIAEMRWIQRLSPFRRDVAYEGRTLRLEPPVGLVTLDNKRHWSAESPDGARIWASRRRNAPRGDAAFWIEALKLRMAPEFASAEVTEVGGFQVLRLVDRSFEDPYRYLIAVKVVGKRLQVVEVYFPSGVQEKRYGEAVMNSIRKGAL